MALSRYICLLLLVVVWMTGCDATMPTLATPTPSGTPGTSTPSPTQGTSTPSPTPTNVVSPVGTASAPPPPATQKATVDCGVPLQSLVDQAPPGGVVVVPPCIYRETVVVDKPLTLRGQPGAEIRGSDVWSDWTVDGRVWVSSLSVPVFPAHGECQPGTQRCLWPEQVFMNGSPLTQVAADSLPKTGEFALDGQRHVVIADDPAGETVEVTVRRYWIVPEADGIVIEDLRMRHAANDSQEGAITDGGHEVWIRNCKLSDTHGAIVSLSGSGGIENSDLYRGGQLGIHKGGSVVSGNRIHDNNTEDFNSGWEAGGLKSILSGMLIENNVVYDNAGPGIWFDGDAQDTTIVGNTVYGNEGPGILLRDE